jgi:hypothetical protein
VAWPNWISRMNFRRLWVAALLVVAAWTCLDGQALERERGAPDEDEERDRTSERYERRNGARGLWEPDADGRPGQFEVPEVREKEVKGPVRKALTEVSL